MKVNNIFWMLILLFLSLLLLPLMILMLILFSVSYPIDSISVDGNLEGWMFVACMLPLAPYSISQFQNI